jgi:peptidoglycan/xylan/chitin deacetylase (PgdA/CDA1 family)
MPIFPQLDTTRPGGQPGEPRRRHRLVWIVALALGIAAVAAAGLYAATRHSHGGRPAAPGEPQPAAGRSATPAATPAGSPLASPLATPTATPTANPFAGLPVASLPRPIARFRPAAAGATVTAPRTLAVPILMYHVVGPPPPREPYPGLFVSRAAFVAQLRYLAGHGYRAVSLQRLYDFWHGRAALPRHPVVLSFDDGYRQDFSVVAPLLKELHWPGVLDLIVRNTRPGQDMRPPYVRALIAAGWEVDSHTVNHLDLTTLPERRLRYELVGSRRDLRRLFGVPVNFFCYPSGSYDPAVVQAAKAAGYLAAMTTNPGLAGPAQPYRLARLRVAGGESLQSFAAALRDAVPGATPAAARVAGG